MSPLSSPPFLPFLFLFFNVFSASPYSLLFVLFCFPFLLVGSSLAASHPCSIYPTSFSLDGWVVDGLLRTGQGRSALNTFTRDTQRGTCSCDFDFNSVSAFSLTHSRVCWMDGWRVVETRYFNDAIRCDAKDQAMM